MVVRVKICGLTRIEDVDAAVSAGADAIGFVFYPSSPRYVAPDMAARLAARIPPFVTIVGLFVNASVSAVQDVLSKVPLHVLQFHGEESEVYCRQFDRPYFKVARMRPDLDLLEYAASFPSAQAILLDAFVKEYGGQGQSFDWSLIPQTGLDKPIVLSGGLSVDNVAEAIASVKPAAVDVSSGVEVDKGIKSHEKIREFIAEVRKVSPSI